MPIPSRRTRVLLAVAVPGVAVLGAVGIASALSPSPTPAVSPARVTIETTPTTGVTSATTRVTSATTPTSLNTPATTPTSLNTPVTVGNGVDFSGPCDEAENVNDARCTGAGQVDDNRGPGNGGGDDDNRGPGNGGGDDDNSGPGNGGGDDDNGGHGGSTDD